MRPNTSCETSWAPFIRTVLACETAWRVWDERRVSSSDGPVAKFGNGGERGWTGSDLPRRTQPENRANPPVSWPADKLCDRPLVTALPLDRSSYETVVGLTVTMSARISSCFQSCPG